ncbi:hypothetical protein MCANUFG1_02625 [Mycoplasmopsis canis UFG1]|uniref:hypothetical protein n=1 Tax=Mycoplasmopsis canis TaxID=29555 RepID=UPI00025B07FA|nr:hypothetical protein [Mycoplasmopsis canis]EIE41206.1 hypothetical protein MCANUFG1_02625 [Mycoplasmopsis canis UFG1]
MGTRVHAKCIKCEREYDYLFGSNNEYDLYNTFLEIYEDKQVNLFDKNIFFETYKELLKEHNNEGINVDEILEYNYSRIMSFFLPDEIELLKTNIFHSHDLRIHTVYNSDLEPASRVMLYIPFLKVNFLDGSEYTRKYTKNAKFVEFSEDQRFLSCAFCGTLTAAFQSEQEV